MPRLERAPARFLFIHSCANYLFMFHVEHISAFTQYGD